MPPTPDSSTGLLVVTIDRLPAWMAAAWGGTWVATPALDTVAARGVVFDRVLAPTLDPRRSARDLVRGEGRGLADAIAARGWSLAAVTDQPEVVAAVGLGAEAEVTAVPAARTADVAADVAATNVGRLFAAAGRVAAAGRHRALWCHVGSLGIAWDAPHELRDRYLDPDDPPPPPGAGVPNMAVGPDTDPDLIAGLRHVFAAQVTLLDHCLGELVQAFAPAGSGGIILVSGLRGLPLGIHGRLGGGPEPESDPLPYGEAVHVPAILVDAAGRMAAQRYGGLVIPADLGATAADLVAGQVAPPPLHACQPASLAGLYAAWQARPRDRVVIRGSGGDAIATPGWHAILPHAPNDAAALLFAKPDDFFEVCDVADRESGVAEELARVLRAGAGREPVPAWEEKLSAAAVSAAS